MFGARLVLSPREDFPPFFTHPGANRAQITAYKREERARESSIRNLEQIRQYLAKDGGRSA